MTHTWSWEQEVSNIEGDWEVGGDDLGERSAETSLSPRCSDSTHELRFSLQLSGRLSWLQGRSSRRRSEWQTEGRDMVIPELAGEHPRL